MRADLQFASAMYGTHRLGGPGELAGDTWQPLFVPLTMSGDSRIGSQVPWRVVGRYQTCSSPSI